MKVWQTTTATAVLCVIVVSLLTMVIKAQAEQLREAPEEIKIYRYYNESSNVECFYHQNAISCLWVMDGGK